MPTGCLLYYITDRTAFAADEPTRRKLLLEKIAEAVCAGVDYIQLREKDLPAKELQSLASKAVAIVNKLKIDNLELKTALLINSRTDIALAAGADGVHLRSDDISAQEIRKIWHSADGICGAGTPARAPVIGVSCHSPEEVRHTQRDGASFAVFAPVFEKKDSPQATPAGLKALEEACLTPIPVLALGGIHVENAESCLKAGAAGIAAIRLFQEHDAADIASRLRNL